jgi:hypothetical protein
MSKPCHQIQDYDIQGYGVHMLRMPADSMIVSVLNLRGTLMLYAFSDTTRESEQRVVEVVGTDDMIDDSPDVHRHYIGSALMLGAAVHVFERRT